MFLDAEQVARLTGKKRPKAQCAVLAAEGYHFRVNSCGEPIVLVAEVNKRFGLELEPQSVRAPAEKSILDWQAMQRRGMVRTRGPQKNTQ